ncbi:MAG: hypothetical protein JWR80_5218 [Bradyrhizobium sp.]|nr:hypothetical protein [Bradyrhizobium sp.]
MLFGDGLYTKYAGPHLPDTTQPTQTSSSSSETPSSHHSDASVLPTAPPPALATPQADAGRSGNVRPGTDGDVNAGQQGRPTKTYLSGENVVAVYRDNWLCHDFVQAIYQCHQIRSLTHAIHAPDGRLAAVDYTRFSITGEYGTHIESGYGLPAVPVAFVRIGYSVYEIGADSICYDIDEMHNDDSEVQFQFSGYAKPANLHDSQLERFRKEQISAYHPSYQECFKYYYERTGDHSSIVEESTSGGSSIVFHLMPKPAKIPGLVAVAR